MYLTAREQGAKSREFTCPRCSAADSTFIHEHMLPDSFWGFQDIAYQVHAFPRVFAMSVCVNIVQPPLAITHHTRMLGFHLMGMARCRCGSSAISADTSGESDSSSSPGAPNVSSHHPPLEIFLFRMCAKR